MKLVYLILYLYHGSYRAGGPVLTITPMPSLAACEVVGQAAKALSDANAPGPGDHFGPVSAFRCVEVAR